MLLKKLCSLISTVALVGLLNSSTLRPAQAQGTVQPNPLQSFNIPPSLFFGFVGQASGGIDPTHSSAMQLLQRNDVRNEIALDLKQQAVLESLQTKSQQDFQATLQKSVQESIKALQSATQDQQQTQIQDRMDQFATTIQAFQGDLDKRIEAILRSKQVTRLRELDLRWRGPLAFSDPKVSAALKLTLEQTGQVNALVKEFMDGQQKAVTKAMAPAANPADSGQDTPPTPQERMQQMQKKIYSAMHSREMEKTKMGTEAKLLELLIPAQKAQWTAMQGARFTFRMTEVP